MARFLPILSALVLLACSPGPQAAAESGGLDGIYSGCPLVIEASPGGDVEAFRLHGLWLLEHHVPIIVDGECDSACTALVDVARANVCITTDAIFGYHQQYWTDKDGKDHYSRLSFETPGLNAYLESRGGQPATRDDVLYVDFEIAKRFYKPCPGAEGT